MYHNVFLRNSNIIFHFVFFHAWMMYLNFHNQCHVSSLNPREIIAIIITNSIIMIIIIIIVVINLKIYQCHIHRHLLIHLFEISTRQKINAVK